MVINREATIRWKGYDPNDLIDEYLDPDDTGEDYAPDHPNSPQPNWD